MKSRMAIIGAGPVLGPLLAMKAINTGANVVVFDGDRKPGMKPSQLVIPQVIDPGALKLLLTSKQQAQRITPDIKLQYNAANDALRQLKPVLKKLKITVCSASKHNRNIAKTAELIQASNMVELQQTENVVTSTKWGLTLNLPVIDMSKADMLKLDSEKLGVIHVNRKISSITVNKASSLNWKCSIGAFQRSFSRIIDMAAVYMNSSMSRNAAVTAVAPFKHEGEPELHLIMRNGDYYTALYLDGENAVMITPASDTSTTETISLLTGRSQISARARALRNKFIRDSLHDIIDPRLPERHDLIDAMKHSSIAYASCNMRDPLNLLNGCVQMTERRASMNEKNPSMLTASPHWNCLTLPQITSFINDTPATI